MKSMMLVGVLALSGCAHAIKTETVEVKIPVGVYCIDQIPTEPAYAVEQLTSSDSDYAVVNAYMVDRHQRIMYITQLQAAVAGCVQQQ